MKANRGQMERALDAPGQGAAADVRFFLLYGPDEAGSQALAKRLERLMKMVLRCRCGASAEGMSVVEPRAYASRFNRMIERLLTQKGR